MGVPLFNIGTVNGSAGATQALTAVNAPVGAIVVVAVTDASNGAGGGSMTDSAGNVYTPLGKVALNNTQASGFLNLFLTAPLTVALAAATITYTRAVSGAAVSISALYVVGTTGLDTAATASAFGTVATAAGVTSGVPTNAGERFFAFLGASTQAPTTTLPAGWSNGPPTNVTSTPRLYGATILNAGSGAETASFGTSGAASPWAAYVLAFLPAAQEITSIGVGFTAGVSATASIAVPAGGVPAGAVIVLAIHDNANTAGVGSVADTAGNVYTSIGKVNTAGVQANGYINLFYAVNVIALVNGNTIVFTKPVNATAVQISAAYITGAATTSPLDATATASATGTSATPSVTSGVPAVAGEMMIGIIGNDSSTSAVTPDAPFAEPPNSQAGTVSAGVLRPGSVSVAIVAAQTFSLTLGGSNAWAALIVGFKPPTAATVQPPIDVQFTPPRRQVRMTPYDARSARHDAVSAESRRASADREAGRRFVHVSRAALEAEAAAVFDRLAARAADADRDYFGFRGDAGPADETAPVTIDWVGYRAVPQPDLHGMDRAG